MTVKIVLEFATAAHAIAFLSDADFEGEVVGEGVLAAAGEKRGRGRPPKAAVAAVAAQPAAAAVAAAPAQVAQPAATAVPFKSVADAITELAEKDRDTAVALLGKFGAARANDLKPEQYAAFVAECKAALTPTAAAAPSLI